MEPIIQMRGPYPKADKNGNIRGYCKLSDGRQMHYARLVMMNFLHTNHIPKRIHVHHKDENSLNDDIGNLELKLIGDHMRGHHPHDYKYGVSKAENRKAYEKAWKNDPIRKERLLAKRRERAKIYMLDPLWVEKNRERQRKLNKKVREAKKDDPIYQAKKIESGRRYWNKHKDELNARRRKKREESK